MTVPSNTPETPVADVTTETVPAVEVATPVADPAAVAAPETSPAVDVGVADPAAVEPGPAATAATSETSDPVVGEVSWNGELDALETAPWWNKVNEPVRNAVQDGLRSKIKNLEGDYTRKTQTLSEQRKELEATEEARQAKIADLELSLIHI